MLLASFRYGAHDVEREPRHAEILAYVQTTRDLVRALEPVELAKQKVPAGQAVITVAGEASWPLTWYLRDVPVKWVSRVEDATTPIIVSDWNPEGGLEKQLADKRKSMQGTLAKLENANFVKSAPAAVVQQQREQVADLQKQIETIETNIKDLQ